jgi:hypothetical protein
MTSEPDPDGLVDVRISTRFCASRVEHWRRFHRQRARCPHHPNGGCNAHHDEDHDPPFPRLCHSCRRRVRWRRRGCHRASPGPTPSADINGTYALTQVRTLGHLSGGGSGLPVDFVDGSGDHLVFLSGTLILGADGTFDMKVQVTFKGNPSELTDYGTYSATSGGITFGSQKSTPRLSTGTVSGNQITAQSQFGGIPFEIDVVK